MSSPFLLTLLCSLVAQHCFFLLHAATIDRHWQARYFSLILSLHRAF